MNAEDSLPRFEKRALFLQLLLAAKEVEIIHTERTMGTLKVKICSNKIV